MKNISEIDRNLAVQTKFTKTDITLYDVTEEPFSVHGLICPKDKNDVFRRMDEKTAEATNEGVYGLHTHTAGGRVRFKTDSKYIAIHAEMHNVSKMPHMPFSGSVGFDLYKTEPDGEKYVGTYIPPVDVADSFEGERTISSAGMCDYTINFPLYSGVKRLYVALEKGAKLEKADKLKAVAPIVYYGSSITQGGCASRPGNSYQSIIYRRTGVDYLNLGFSGSARAEQPIAEYISKLDMSIFVYDYDHNAPTEDYLAATHEKMFKTIRGANPTLPIICVSSPTDVGDTERRRSIIRTTVENARKNGDENVWFINGGEFAENLGGDSISVDTCHPNDLGFMSMANIIGKKIDEILK